MSLQSTDPIADLLTRIRNAKMVNKHQITVPASKLKMAILKALKNNDYITDVKLEKAVPQNNLIVTINPENESANFTELKRLSKPGKRMYAKAANIPKVKNGRGLVLVSTSKGIMTGDDAKKHNLGGELLMEIY